ncbi:MAG: efflux RND transporter permease subunit [Planctomycetota bacterium]|nr:efflux RND transporter permease subunit [Planctomycetota bacterium]
MTRFFIARPIFACSIALLMVVAGVVSILTLPITQYPPIVPGTVFVESSFPGASAEVTSATVTTPIEQQVNGVDGMIYMSSNSTTNGTSNITVTFEVGYPTDIGAVGVLNRVQTALSQLPDVTQKIGITIRQSSPDITVVLNLRDTTGNYDNEFLGNWMQINMIDPLYRIPQIGLVNNVGELTYSIRIWLDESKMSAMGIAVDEVIDAVEAQNIDSSLGLIGAPPLPGEVAFQYQLNALGQLPEPEMFEEIVVRVGEDGQVVQVKDIGRAELGAADYQTLSKLNGEPTATALIYQRPGTNALELSNNILELIDQLEPRLPEGITIDITHNNNDFIVASMKELVWTLLEAIGLVVLVVFVFLQSWRTTLIPVIAIPVSLVGTFAILTLFGFSINTLSLLGLVLAVGLVVDDAIVVVENVERQLEDGLDRVAAAVQAMKEVTPPIVATTAVLMAVFVPSAFSPGLTGQMYNQFALTIAFSVLLSAFNSLSLSPALAAVFLKPTARKDRFAPFRWFNRGFDALADGYSRLVGFLSRRLVWLVMIVFAALLGLTWERLSAMDTGFIPNEDQGYFFMTVELPGGASLERTEEACREVAAILRRNPNVVWTNAISGMNFIDTYAETCSGFIVTILKPWSERTTPESQIPGLFDVLMKDLASYEKATCIPLNPPPIPGLGSVGGFEFEVLDYMDKGNDELVRITNQLLDAAEKRPELTGMVTDVRNDIPQLYLDIDRLEAQRLGLDLSDVWKAFQVYFGSLYVNNWNKYNQVYEVNLQAEGEYRMNPDDVGRIRIPNRDGEPIPVNQFATLQEIASTNNIPHYNVVHSALVIGKAADGYSSGQAQDAMEELAREVLVPQGYGYDWTGTVYQAVESGDVQPYIFLLSVIVIFLVLAALYESWTIPLIILLSVPLAILGAVIALDLRGIALDVYGQIGMLMLFGLAAKNAILIVEFAVTLREEGRSVVEAATEAARLRLRPILMTALAFILGVLPLALASGASANCRHSIGTTVIGGMIASTFLSLLVVPILYVLVESIRERITGGTPSPEPPTPVAPGDPA